MARFLAEARVGEADPDASTGHTVFILRVKQYMKIATKVIKGQLTKFPDEDGGKI